MKTYNQFITEAAQYQNSIFYLLFAVPYKKLNPETNAILPLSQAMIERTIGTVPIYAAHVTSIENLETLKKLQNKRSKQISTYTAENSIGAMSKFGIWGGAGIVAIVRGFSVAGMGSDLGSAPDKKGTRTISMRTKDFPENVTPFINKVVALREKLLDKYLKGSRDPKIISDTDNTIKFKMIKDYFDAIEILMKKYKKELHDALMGYAVSQSGAGRLGNIDNFYDEVVVSNFKIVKLIVNKEQGQHKDGREKQILDVSPQDYFENKKQNFPIIFTTDVAQTVYNQLMELNK